MSEKFRVAGLELKSGLEAYYNIPNLSKDGLPIEEIFKAFRKAKMQVLSEAQSTEKGKKHRVLDEESQRTIGFIFLVVIKVS